MRNLFCGLFLIGLSLAAQTKSQDDNDRAAVASLNSILMAVHREGDPAAANSRLATAILSAADRYHQPSRATVLRFSDKLTNALASRERHGLAAVELPGKLVSQVSTSVIDVLGSAGIGTHRFHQSVDRARQALTALGLPDWKVRNIAECLTIIGNEVRGPGDVPVLPAVSRSPWR